jgi:ribosomal protein S18 acetylase RimI-like enzyme
MTTLIRPISSSDHADWLVLWNEYLAFYEQDLAAATTAKTWKTLVSTSGHDCLVAIDPQTQKPIGFVTYLFHASTWTDRGYCYLEDLYVKPQSRRCGAGAALIQAVVDVASHRRVTRVYWHTDEKNKTAQQLYEKVAQKSDALQFRITTDK